jgi:hypothetical protein
MPYRQIPTWQEAISYLLNPSRVESHAGPRGTPEGESGHAAGDSRRHKSGPRSSRRRRRR